MNNQKVTVGNKIEIVDRGVVYEHVDAIVNAANTTLLGGGGVDGAIHKAAGPALMKECRSLGGCATGEAKITKGYGLNAPFIIHTVGPVYIDGEHGEPELLAACYNNSLEVMIENNLRTIAFPCISTGVYGYPLGEAGQIALKTALEFVERHESIGLIRFCCFNRDEFETYRREANKILSP